MDRKVEKSEGQGLQREFEEIEEVMEQTQLWWYFHGYTDMQKHIAHLKLKYA